MEIETKYFGSLPFSSDEEIKFEKGIFGFQQDKRFVLIRFDNESGNILCLQSLDDVDLAFTVMNPFAFIPDYTPTLTEEELRYLDADDEKELNFYNICVIAPEIKNSTVNLRCPVAVNPENKKAIQVILENNRYEFKYPFYKFLKEG